MNRLLVISAILFLGTLLWQCGGSSEKSGEGVKTMDRRTAVRFQQYRNEGKKIYVKYCLACHQENGEGLADLYPPLAKSDYLVANVEKVPCWIRNGQQGPIVVNGKEYNMLMPAIPNLRDLEIAEVMTYVGNSWGNDLGLIEVKQVTRYLKDCKKNQ